MEQGDRLGLERKAAVVWRDETEARQVADGFGLPKTGVVGIWLRGKWEEKWVSLRPEWDRLREEAGFWISDDLYRRVLERAGEDVRRS